MYVGTVRQFQMLNEHFALACGRNADQTDTGRIGRRRLEAEKPSRHWSFGVEVRGFEPLASSVRGKRSAGLSYTPRRSEA